MGLDQKLIKKIYVGGKYAKNCDDTFVVKGEKSDLTFKISDIDCITKSEIVWRKNYAINDWFLKRVNPDNEPDNCKDFYVENDILLDLKLVLKKIITSEGIIKKLEIAKKELPSFDLEEYFEIYLDDFRETYDKLCEIIESKDFEKSQFYYWIWY